MHTVSVIVPIYNGELYIENCVSSIINQDYSNLEILLINDGSSDNSLEICREYVEKDKRIKLITQENAGVSAARNAGMNVASGEWITFVDVDDTLESHAVSAMLDIALSESADIVAIRPQKEISYEIWEGKTGLERSLEDNPFTYSVWSKLYRRVLLEEIRFVSGKRVHEDSFFLFECFMKQPRVVVLEGKIYNYNVTPNSASRAPFSEKFFDILYFAEEKMKLVHKNYPELTRKSKTVWLKANMALLHNLCKTWDQKYRTSEKKCIREIIDNKNDFIPATKADKIWFWIITHHLYGVYKIYLWATKKMSISYKTCKENGI